MTSDCDFTPLATRILSKGKAVIGFGERKLPSASVNACSTFLFLDDEEEKPVARSKQNELRGDSKLMNLIRDAISGTENEEGWAKLSKVAAHISNHASFDARNYGYSHLSDLIEAIGLFELRRDEHMHVEVRNGKRKA